MQQLRCIATYSRRLGAPQNIHHPKSQYVAKRQPFALTEFKVRKHQQPLPGFQMARLTQLPDEGNKLSSTQSRVINTHVLMCYDVQ